MIKVQGLKKNFGPKQVLKGIDVDIESGKILSIIGGSGSGKSTFIKCIIRLLQPDGGKIFVDGKDVTRLRSEYDLAVMRKKFGYLFQEGALFDSMTVGENVAFGLKYMTDISPTKYSSIVREKLALVGLRGIEHLKPAELSGGMKKRVSLARAIAAEPDYILYDEPTSGLDPIMAAIIDELILDMKNKLGVTSIVITHHMNSAYRISDTIAMLYDGHFVQMGSPKEFKSSENPYVKQFVEGLSQGPIKMKITDQDDD
jgi:phospholipid/cholesterol/gamma-HCH transport system ATP-binding protein